VFDRWKVLTPEQKKAAPIMLRAMSHNSLADP